MSASQSHLVASVEQLRHLRGQLSPVGQIALDCEADSLHAYPEKLCLLQVAAGDVVALVDPLAFSQPAPAAELREFCQLLATKKLLLHGADFDLRLLYRTFEVTPVELFDTMEAARLLGWRGVGLKAVVERTVGHRLHKGSQRANWARRPLPPKMIAYATEDVTHLEAVAQILRDELESQGRLAWHQQVCGRVITSACQPQEVDHERVWRLKGSRSLGRLGLAVLRELWHERERLAVASGRPPYFVVAHERLLEVASAAENQSVATRELVSRLGLRGRRAVGFGEAIARARALPADQYPRRMRAKSRPQLSGEQQHRLSELKQRRDTRAQALGLDPTLIAPKSLLVALARGEQPQRLLGWQRQLLGLAGQAAKQA